MCIRDSFGNEVRDDRVTFPKAITTYIVKQIVIASELCDSLLENVANFISKAINIISPPLCPGFGKIPQPVCVSESRPGGPG